MNFTLDTPLSNQWNLWIHNNNNDWTINGFKKLITVKTIKDFWILNNNWDNNGNITKHHYFFMKDDILPIWEDTNNKNGGCWSFKIKSSLAQNLWDDLVLYMVTNNLNNNFDDINGISCSVKKNNSAVIKIWNKDNKKSSLKNINSTILKKWGVDIIYIAHLPN